MPPQLYILTGSTAVGKTELALRWAESRGAEIISCDSLLFYRGADIGTAKPSRDELARVPHHLIDICAITEQMDITRFVLRARKAIEEILSRGHLVLVTGGSGFYLKAFFYPVADGVDVPAEIRNEVRGNFERDGLGSLLARLRELNPDGLGRLDVQNPRRVMRALERCLASGRPLAVLQAEFAAQSAPFADYNVQLCELVRDKTDLEARIDRRVTGMLQAGLVDEVRQLLSHGLKQNPSAAGAIGYRETIDFLEGRLPDGELGATIARHTRTLVKKQMTWFRTQLPGHRKVDAASASEGSLFPPPI